MKKLEWFKCCPSYLGGLDSLDRASIGEALCLILRYAKSMGEDESIEKGITNHDTKIAFGILKEGVIESIEALNIARENGKKGQEIRRRNEQKKNDMAIAAAGSEDQDAGEVDTGPAESVSRTEQVKQRLYRNRPP